MKKVLMMLVGALAFAFTATAAAIGNNWISGAGFDGTDNKWAPSPLPTGASFASDALVLDNVETEVYYPGVSALDVTYTNLTVNTTAKFVASTDLAEVPATAKAAATARTVDTATTYWVLQRNSEGTANEWVDTGITADLVNDVEVQIVIAKVGDDYQATYTFGENTPVVKNVFIASTIEKVAYLGSGSVTALSGNYVDYAPVVINFANAEVAGLAVTYSPEVASAVPGTEITATYADDTKIVTGEKTAIFVVQADGSLELKAGSAKPTASDPEAKIGTTLYLTLKAALDEAQDDDVVTLVADVTYAGGLAADITIDVNNHKLIFPNEEITLANNVTFVNNAVAAGEWGVQNYAQITIAAGKTLDLSAFNWAGEGLIATEPGATTATFTLANGANLVMGGKYWDDSFLTIVSAETGYKIQYQVVDNIATITTAAKAFVIEIVGGAQYETIADAIAAAKDGDTLKLLSDVTYEGSLAADITIDVNNHKLIFPNEAITLANNVKFVNNAVAAGEWGVQNYAQISIAAGKTLDLSAFNWAGEGLIATEPGATTATFTLANGANLVMGGKYWDDSFLTIVSAETGYKIQYQVVDNIATITTAGKAFVIEIVDGEKYETVDEAFAAAKDGDTLKLLAGAEVAADTTFNKTFTLDLNGQQLTATTATIASGTLKLINSKSKAPALSGSEGGFAPNGVITVADGAVLDLSELPFGTTYGGIEGSGSLTLASGSESKFYKWNVASVDSANWMYWNYPPFFTGSTIPQGAKVTIGDKTWTGTANGFELEGTVAFAKIDAKGNIGGTTFPLVVNECYTSLDDAIAAVKADCAVTLVANAELASLSKAAKIDLNGKDLSLAGDTLANDLTIVGSTGKLIASGTKNINANLDLSALNYAAQLAGNTGVFAIAAGKTVTLPVELDVWTLAATDMFAGSADGAKVATTAGSYIYGNGVWTEGETIAAAKIGVKGYASLAAALDAAVAGDTVTLVADIETATAQQWNLAKNITLDFADKKITKTVANDWVFTVVDGAEVIFTGTTGGIVHKPAKLNQGNPASMIQINGKLTVNGGVYESDFTVFKTDDVGTKASELVINDGTFTITAEPLYAGQQTYAVMNWCNTTIKGGTFNGAVIARSYSSQVYPSIITIDGGTFNGAVGFTQYKTTDTNAGTIKVADGLSIVPTKLAGNDEYKVTSSTETGYTIYTLSKKAFVIEIVDGEKYETVDEAIAAAKAGDTIKLLADIETATAQQWNLDKNITLDFADKKITKTVANDWVFTVVDGAEVIFTGTTGGIVHKPAKLNQGNPASMIQINGKLTVNGGVYESDFTVFKTDDVGTKASELVINDGTFTITAEPLYAGKQTYAVMNWCNTTIKGGTFNGAVIARSYSSQVYPSIITIDGGTFNGAVGFTQLKTTDTNAGTIKVADGLSIVPTKLAGNEEYVVTSSTETGYTVYTLGKDEPQDWPEDPTEVQGQKAADVFGESVPEELANVDACELSTWAKGVGNVSFANKDAIKTDAYLLNCANTDAAIADAKAAFKLTIEIVDGEPVITAPEGYNGTVVKYGCTDLTAGAWHEQTEGDKYFKAELVVKELAAE